jgi:hypothetical protein
MNWDLYFRVYCIAGICLAAPACKQAKEAPTASILKEETRDEVCGTTFGALAQGGRLYVGTIESVTVTDREAAGFAVDSEGGKFTVRVQQAVRGPAVKELHLSYDFLDHDPNQPNAGVFGDWGRGAWTRRPCVGEQLLLLLTLNPYHRAEQNWEKHSIVTHVWVGVNPDHSLVKDFEVAVRYLDSHDKDERRTCFRQLRRSTWPSIRDFALDAAFDGAYRYGFLSKHKAEDEDWSPESRLMLEYIKTTGPLLTDWERLNLTRTLRFALCFGYDHIKDSPFAVWVSHQANWAAAEWLAAFEDWYLTELGIDAMRPKPERSEQALIELRALVHHCGVAGAIAFFRKRGLAGLEERLKVCVRSPDPYLSTNAKQMMDILRAGRKIAAGNIRNSEGDAISLQTVLPDVVLHIDMSYSATNLPPGVRMDPDTGVISGRLQAGAAKNSPYKVSITCHSRWRQNPEQIDHTTFVWQVRP